MTDRSAQESDDAPGERSRLKLADAIAGGDAGPSVERFKTSLNRVLKAAR